LFFADLDGDGQVEILAYQGPGVFGARMYRSWPQVAPACPQSTCLSAFTKDGTRRWTFGEPNPTDPPYICHAHESCVAVGDVDGDGVVEVALAAGDTLYLLDGPTGRPRAQAALPEDNFFIVQILGEPTDGQEAALVVKNGEGGYGPWRYGEPVIGLNANLEVAWGSVALPGGGHHVLALDLDQDGRREYLVGYALVRPSGEWTCLVDAVDPATVNPSEEHVDYTDVLALGPEVGAGLGASPFVLGFAGSNKGYLVTHEGRTLFVRPDVHVQGCALGRFRADSAYQLALYNDDGPLSLYDPTGRELWRVPTPELWPLGQPQSCAGHVFHRNRPLVKLSLDQDYLLFTDGGWPWAMDGEGQIVVHFEPPAHSRQPEAAIPAKARGDDMGYGFATQSVNWDSDDRLQPVIYDRRYLWVFDP
jgi:hypothetical protein